MAKKQTAQVPEASEPKRIKLFSKPFEDWESEPEVDMLAQHEVATGNAFYNQGKACLDKSIGNTISVGFKRSIDRKCAPSGSGKPPKTNREKAKSIVKQAKKWNMRDLRYLRDQLTELIGE